VADRCPRSHDRLPQGGKGNQPLQATYGQARGKAEDRVGVQAAADRHQHLAARMSQPGDQPEADRRSRPLTGDAGRMTAWTRLLSRGQ
jgi:hypothetical protein